MSLASIVQQSMLRQGLAAPAVVFASADSGVQQRIALLQDIGDELSERYTWQTLNQPATIVCDGTSTMFPLPPDWGGLSEGQTLQSTAFPTWPVQGPVNNEQLAMFKALPAQPVQPVWRIIDQHFEFFPAPISTEVYTYNYYSIYWINNKDGVPQAAWTADTDVSLIPDSVLTSGLEWRWLKSKGLDYSEEFRRYETRLGRAAGRNDNQREVNMSSRMKVSRRTWPGVFPIYDGSGESSYIGPS